MFDQWSNNIDKSNIKYYDVVIKWLNIVTINKLLTIPWCIHKVIKCYCFCYQFVFGNSVLCYFILDVLTFADESCFLVFDNNEVIKYYCPKVNIYKRHPLHYDIVTKWLNIITLKVNIDITSNSSHY